MGVITFMLKVFLINHNYEYQVRELLKLFYNSKEIKIYNYDCVKNEEINDLNNDFIINQLSRVDNKVIVTTKGFIGGQVKENTETLLIKRGHYNVNRSIKLIIKSSLYKILTDFKKIELPWGFLVGIRPSKIVHKMLDKGETKEQIFNTLTDKYYLSKEKASLLIDVAITEHKYIYPVDDKKISIYISIPFCPTRCSYCSFPSNILDDCKKYLDAYISALCNEIRKTSELIKDKQVESIYIGGGTPTTLNTNHFIKIFSCIKKYLNILGLSEFTVEAGRPDTINFKKLDLFKKNAVTRISINPQTMNNCTLNKIGRKHTAEQIIEAYNLAKTIGFNSINMDVIIGLPGENTEMVRNTMECIKRMGPSNLTVHTLAIKTTSKLRDENYLIGDKNRYIVNMLDITKEYAYEMNLKPYYLYRQKHMVDNLENIGYAKVGHECIYNMQMMGEKQTIIAMGAGAVSKIVFSDEDRLERVANVKNLQQYIERVDEMVERKKKTFLKRSNIIF